MISHFSSSDDSSQEEEGDEDPAFGGVSIKVFRGPSKVKGRETFAPFGYYVKMPVDTHQKKESGEEEEDNASEEFQFNSDENKDEEDFE